MLAARSEKFETRRPWCGLRGIIPGRARALDGFANFPSFSRFNPFGKRCSIAAEWIAPASFAPRQWWHRRHPSPFRPPAPPLSPLPSSRPLVSNPMAQKAPYPIGWIFC